MNIGGIPYMLGNPSGKGVYSTEFTDPYFDVYGEVQTRYSQVYWTRNDPVPLPADIVTKFAGKVIAITGYECDQVLRTAKGDESFPIYYAYNHHYFAWLTSDNAEFVRLPKPKNPHDITRWEVRDKPGYKGAYPTNIVFKENPGGEYRKSYHGYPNGYAQLLESPKWFVIEPMQIDTHNRVYNGTGYKPWFWPKNIVNTTDPNSMLDPLIECPCSDRISRVVIPNSAILITGTCTDSIVNADDCFKAAEKYVTVSSENIISDANLPAGCVLSPDVFAETFTVLFNDFASTQTCGFDEDLPGVTVGKTQSLVTLKVLADPVNNNVTITMSGKDGNWFGVGFNAHEMCDLPYAIIVNGDGTAYERRLGCHMAGTVLSPSIKVLSSSVVDGVRTVVMTRPVNGLTSEHYTFPSDPATIPFINALGGTPTISYHIERTAASITTVPAQVNSCLCAPVNTTYLSYMNASMDEYDVYCAPEPRGDMLQQNNPACKMQTYMGGLHCCHHLWFLTDVEQESLIPDAVDTYYLKFRYYYQEYIPANGNQPPSHYHLHHWVFLIDSEVNDYEEVQCSDGTMCEGYISAHLTAADMGLEDIPDKYTGIMPLVITAHCHAPSCIREELYNADTGELLCRAVAQYGTGSEPFNEAGYLALPPCLFGHQAGLKDPVVLSPDTRLTAMKVFNNSYRHLGQMAQWTGLMVYLNGGTIEDPHVDFTPKIIKV